MAERKWVKSKIRNADVYNNFNFLYKIFIMIKVNS